MSEWEEVKAAAKVHSICRHALEPFIQAADAEITRLQENQLPDWLMHKNRKVDVRNLKECIKHQELEITRIKEELAVYKGALKVIAGHDMFFMKGTKTVCDFAREALNDNK